jgi:hypothetical protein
MADSVESATVGGAEDGTDRRLHIERLLGANSGCDAGGEQGGRQRRTAAEPKQDTSSSLEWRQARRSTPFGPTPPTHEAAVSAAREGRMIDDGTNALGPAHERGGGEGRQRPRLRWDNGGSRRNRERAAEAIGDAERAARLVGVALSLDRSTETGRGGRGHRPLVTPRVGDDVRGDREEYQTSRHT